MSPGHLLDHTHYQDYPAVLVRLGQVELTELITESWRLNAPEGLLAAFDEEHEAVPRNR